MFKCFTPRYLAYHVQYCMQTNDSNSSTRGPCFLSASRQEKYQS